MSLPQPKSNKAPRKLSRNQKRKTLSILNNPTKLKAVIEKHERAKERELELFRNSRKRKLAIVAISILTALIITAFLL